TNSFFDALGNGALLLNLVAELAGGENLLDIRPRDYAIAALELSNTQLLLSFVLTAVLGPLLMLGAGLVVWWRRR
ncbi:MAG: GldG family protein, partial [Gammaproteobacteria bacterium]